MPAELHLAEDALALHLFLERPEGLVDIIVADENLHRLLLWSWRLQMQLSPPICRRSAIARALDLRRI